MTEFGDKGDGITRRDFLDGVAITAAGLAAAAAAPHLSGAEALAASRGHAPAAAAAGLLPADRHRASRASRTTWSADIMRIDGPPNQRDVHSTKGGPGIHVRHVRDSDETYDCVIVGAGASGLAAAKYYRDRFGEDSRILLLDPLPDFGGHSHRNEFHVGPTTFLKNGGTVNLDTVTSWNQTTGGLQGHPGLVRPAGGRHARVPRRRRVQLPEHVSARASRRATGCGRWCCSRPRTGARTRSSRTRPRRRAGRNGSPRRRSRPRRRRASCASWRRWSRGPDRLDRGQARPEDRRREEGDPLPAHPEALLHGLHRGPGAGDPPVPAQRSLAARRRRAGGLGRRHVGAREPGLRGPRPRPDPFPGIGRTPQMGLQEGAEDSPSPTWPDGNSSLLRLLVDRLIPGAVSAPAARRRPWRTSSTR